MDAVFHQCAASPCQGLESEDTSYIRYPEIYIYTSLFKQNTIVRPCDRYSNKKTIRCDLLIYVCVFCHLDMLKIFTHHTKHDQVSNDIP